jgi:ribonuclease HI
MGEAASDIPKRQLVHLFTDGACIPNPGPGGWAFILRHPVSGVEKHASGGENPSTNNRMEIMAVIRGLEALKRPSAVNLFSDSEYVINGLTIWIEKWKTFGWKKSPKSKTPLKNLDLWRRLSELLQLHALEAEWVRGHVGHPENERCDSLANAAAAKAARTLPTAIPITPDSGAGLFGIAKADKGAQR